MNIDAFLERIKKAERVTFKETMTVIEENFIYTPVQFSNGLGDDPVVNPAGKNEGSCKIFALGRRFGLSKKETASLFGELYWQDVRKYPDGTDHANIRTFLRDGWEGIRLDAEPLKSRNV